VKARSPRRARFPGISAFLQQINRFVGNLLVAVVQAIDGDLFRAIQYPGRRSPEKLCELPLIERFPIDEWEGRYEQSWNEQ
jgi:hypothetical protein